MAPGEATASQFHSSQIRRMAMTKLTRMGGTPASSAMRSISRGLTSPEQCAVLMGDLSAGPKTQSLAAASASAWAALQTAGSTGPWADTFCTWRSDNSPALNPSDSSRMDLVLVRGCAGATVTVSGVLDDKVTLVSGDALFSTPLSDHYGVRAHIAFGCVPGSAESCYGGPLGTEGVGPCKAGTCTCKAQGSGFGPCEGEVVPGVASCTTP